MTDDLHLSKHEGASAVDGIAEEIQADHCACVASWSRSIEASRDEFLFIWRNHLRSEIAR